MKRTLGYLIGILLLASLTACLATTPIKVASKTAKVGVKATSATVKAGADALSDKSAD